MCNKKIVFLASGNGGNFCFIHDAIEMKILDGFEIVKLITDRDCGAKTIARNKNILCETVDFSEPNQQNLLNHLVAINPDLIITTVHKILKTSVIQTFNKKLINLHYSLLPSYAGLIGMEPVHRAIQTSSKLLGVTTHYAEEDVDMGRQIAQIAFPLQNHDIFSRNIKNLVFRCGCLCLLAAIYSQNPYILAVNETVLDISGKKCLLNGAKLPPAYNQISEGFWKSIQQQAK